MISDPSPVQIVRDPEDGMILACAIACDADYLVTRDRDLLAIGEYQGIGMLTPERFAEVVRSSRPR